MYNCECGNGNIPNNHTNAFVDLNGVPYLLAEYLDRNTFQQMDRSLIRSEINIDSSNAMRAVVDINIDDIGKRATDGYPAIIGNDTKLKNLLKMISANSELMDHQLRVLRRGMVVSVNYQLENYRTGQVIRSMNEKFRIIDRNYFVDINPRNINDNAIIVNFCNTMVSTVNEFTHGRDPMMLRITNIQMSYEVAKESANAYSIPVNNNDMYQYHKDMQNRQFIPGYTHNGYDSNTVLPSSWSMFNRFYRFDNNAKDIIIHDHEINHPMTKTALIPCGIVHVNRTFKINPGHRIIFKFCIWKNDVTVVNNTREIARCLGAQILNYPSHDNSCNHHNHNHCMNLDYETMIHILNENKSMEYKQNLIIGELHDKISSLTDLVQSLIPPATDNPDDGNDNDNNETSNECNCDESHEELEEKIDEIDNDVNELQDAVNAIPDVVPISSDAIKEIVAENSQPLDVTS